MEEIIGLLKGKQVFERQKDKESNMCQEILKNLKNGVQFLSSRRWVEWRHVDYKSLGHLK